MSNCEHEETDLDGSLARLSAQDTLFAARPTRLAIQRLQLPTPAGAPIAINVWRNHAFEPLLPLIDAYASFGRWNPSFHLSSYDDSLGFLERPDTALELLWLDRSRLPVSHVLLPWLEERLRTLRAASKGAIVVATWGEAEGESAALQSLADSLPSVQFADLRAACALDGVALLDTRSSTLAGTPLGNAAQLILARRLACHWLPAAVLPPTKAVALDLDQTLHLGVLGEDGSDGVRVSEAHVRLQQDLVALKARGVFLGLISRNERDDVQALFERRDDYPLRWEDFSVIEVSWDDKANALARMARALRIAPDAIVFVDDNPGELAAVGAQLPAVRTLRACDDAEVTRRSIEYLPGLWRWRTEVDDVRRIGDLKANAEREALAQRAVDPAEYFRSLRVTLRVRYDPAEQINRLGDLCAKTNQFNLAIRRLAVAEVAARVNSDRACVASVELSDRLSDSGVIAVIAAVLEGRQLVVEELCISCRAMGRKLEDAIVFGALNQMPVLADCDEVVFRVAHGPRNQPALDWLARHLPGGERPAPGEHRVPAGYIVTYASPEGAQLVHL